MEDVINYINQIAQRHAKVAKEDHKDTYQKILVIEKVLKRCKDQEEIECLKSIKEEYEVEVDKITRYLAKHNRLIKKLKYTFTKVEQEKDNYIG